MAKLKPGGSCAIESSRDQAFAALQSEPLGLLYLPVELLGSIVALLEQSSLRALALTCKATKTFASKALYATYANRDAPSKAAFQLFLRTLCENADLAAMVKGLDIRGWRSEFEIATGLSWPGVTKTRENDKVRSKRIGPIFVSTNRAAASVPKPLKLFEETAVKIGLIPQYSSPSVPALKKTVVVGSTMKKDEDFIRLLRHNVEDAQVVLMLALLPNLTRLHIDGMSAYPTLDWHHFLCKCGTGLRSLRKLGICGQLPHHGGSIHTTTMSFLECIPDLEGLYLSHIKVETPRQVTSLMSKKRLRDFVAVECQIGRQMLRNMLSGHRLDMFQYKPAVGNITASQEDKFAEDHIVDCLKDSQQSLRELTLYSTRPSKSPRLSQFGNLETLEMPYQHGFLDVTSEYNLQSIANVFCKRIPSALSILTLRYVQPSEDVSVAMEVLAGLKHEGKFPELKTIRLNFCRFSWSPWFPPILHDDMVQMAVDTFGEVLEKAGLRLELAQTD